ncbi:hypothetical protein D3C80_1103110 [compost metagenome]
MRELPKHQHCPICKRFVQPSTRYHRYVCQRCAEKTTDIDGKRVAFFNSTYSGHGCYGEFVHSKKPYSGNFCYINGIHCYAEAAYMGGIVIKAF